MLTVPASFDEAARALTLEAAREAGLPTLRLLEEPQAALYDWLFRHRHALADELAERGWCWCATSAAAPPTSAWCASRCAMASPGWNASRSAVT